MGILLCPEIAEDMKKFLSEIADETVNPKSIKDNYLAAKKRKFKQIAKLNKHNYKQ